jgi:hypothetical protein
MIPDGTGRAFHPQRVVKKKLRVPRLPLDQIDAQTPETRRMFDKLLTISVRHIIILKNYHATAAERSPRPHRNRKPGCRNPSCGGRFSAGAGIAATFNPGRKEDQTQVFRKIVKKLLYEAFTNSNLKAVRAQIMEDNRKFIIVGLPLNCCTEPSVFSCRRETLPTCSAAASMPQRSPPARRHWR